jgi:hypothetical protein
MIAPYKISYSTQTRQLRISTLTTPTPDLQRPTERIAEGEQTIRGKYGEHDGHRLPEADGAREGGTTKDERREKAQLNTIGLVVRDAVAAEAV